MAEWEQRRALHCTSQGVAGSNQGGLGLRIGDIWGQARNPVVPFTGEGTSGFEFVCPFLDMEQPLSKCDHLLLIFFIKKNKIKKQKPLSVKMVGLAWHCKNLVLRQTNICLGNHLIKVYKPNTCTQFHHEENIIQKYFQFPGYFLQYTLQLLLDGIIACYLSIGSSSSQTDI